MDLRANRWKSQCRGNMGQEEAEANIIPGVNVTYS